MRTLPFAVCATLLLTACGTPEIDYSQLPDLVRLVTDPPGADVQVEGYIGRFKTPCDIPRDKLPERQLTIEKEGYATFRGTLADIPAGERGMFKLTMQKL